MAMQMPFAGLLMVHRLVGVWTHSQRHLRHRDMLVKLTNCGMERRTFSTHSVKCAEKERDDSDSSLLSTKLTPQQALLSRRRRPLSPLERISSLLPQDALSPEVMQLREQNQQGPKEDTSIQVSVAHCSQEESGGKEIPKEDNSETPLTCDAALEPATPATLPGESLLAFGEILIAEYQRKGRVEFRKMLQLQAGTHLQSSWGTILHDNIAGQPAGRFLKTSRGVPIFIRRASLEDYVLFMKRGPAIAYPKDANTMLMMMDITEGDCVLESGTGSGAMSLFLSKAVGSKGRVVSLDIREDHHRRAVLNYKRWRTSWSIRRGEEWPDNVEFHIADLCRASSLLAGQGFNAVSVWFKDGAAQNNKIEMEVALDLIHPHLVLPTVIPHLHPGAVCALYLANITQVVDLLEGLRCLALPLLCERIIEVPIRDWVVAPALQKDGQYCTRKAPNLQDDDTEEEEEMLDQADEEDLTQEQLPAFGSIPYIARPHPEQMSHTAFLVKLRKCVP